MLTARCSLPTNSCTWETAHWQSASHFRKSEKYGKRSTNGTKTKISAPTEGGRGSGGGFSCHLGHVVFTLDTSCSAQTTQAAGPVIDSCWRTTSGLHPATQQTARLPPYNPFTRGLPYPFCPSLFKLSCSFFGNRSHRFSAIFTTWTITTWKAARTTLRRPSSCSVKFLRLKPRRFQKNFYFHFDTPWQRIQAI